MNARMEAQAGFVTVAVAAAELTRRGDPIDPSNVSRYLARHPEVTSEKRGRCRFVDLAALILHRGGNTLSQDRRDARIIETPEPEADEDDLPPAVRGTPIGSEIQAANLRLKQLQVREKEREDALAEGDLIPRDDLVAVVTGALQAFITELERAEMSIATRHGRVISSDFRKARKAAQAAAAKRLAQLAQDRLHPRALGEMAASEVAVEADAA